MAELISHVFQRALIEQRPPEEKKALALAAAGG